MQNTPNAPRQVGSVLNMMDQFLTDIRQSKEAASRGQTSHVVMSADPGTRPASEGARSSENEADVRKHLGSTGNTGQEDASSAPTNSTGPDIGTTKMTADEVRGNVQQPKATKDGPAEKGRGDASPGHPSNKTLNEKYSSVLDLGKSILSDLAKSGASTSSEAVSENAQAKKPVDAPATKVAKGDTQTPAQVEAEDKTEKEGADKQAQAEQLEKEAAAKYQEDAEWGYATARALMEQMGMGKEAAAETEQAVETSIENIIKSAQDAASRAVDFMDGFERGAQMAAHEKRSLSKRAEGLPPELAAAAAGGGEEGGGMEGMEGMEGAEEMEGGEGEGEGGGGDEEAILAAVAEALDEAGVTPEELAEAVAAEESAGGEEGGEGGAPAAAPAAGPAAVAGM